MANTIINIDTFAKEVSKAIQNQLAGYEVDIRKVDKNNGVVLTGLMVRPSGANVAPTIYLENYFDKYVDGTEEMSDVVEKILETIKESESDSEKLNLDFFKDWDQVVSEISMKLVNKECNEHYLEGKPHFIFGDLAVIFTILMELPGAGKGSVLITYEHLNSWEKTADDLLEAARNNTFSSHTVMGMMEALMGYIPEDADLPDMPEDIMFVATNKEKLYGAAVLINNELLSSFAKKHGSFFVIPSSVHELIFVPDKNDDVADGIDDMINEVNATQVAPEEVLSNHAYYFDVEESALLMRKGGEKLELVAVTE